MSESMVPNALKSTNSTTGVDQVEVKIRAVAEYILIGVFGLLPLFFIPSSAASLEYSKMLFAVSGVFIAIIFYSLSVLRSGKISYGISYSFVALWFVALVAFVSAILSGDIRDALIGNTLGIHTAMFVAFMALAASIWVFVGVSKSMVMKLYTTLFFSSVVLAVFHIVRLFFGPGFLSFGLFTTPTSTPVGSWNDLALLFGLAILLALVTLEQLPLTKWGRALFGFVVAVSLVMLAVINFFLVWIVLGLVSLVILVYSLGKERLLGKPTDITSSGEQNAKSSLSLIFPAVVFIASLIFIIGGSTVGDSIARATGISYIEVRPSVEATAEIAKGVYTENAFLGVGTNKFGDAWRLYKNDSINTTIFWNTVFPTGNGYITTFFVTNGVLGVIAWSAFIILLLASGVRMLLGETRPDRLWFFIGTSSFVGAIYVWGMSIVYTPGITILLLGALCTGLTFVASHALTGKGVRVFEVGSNKRAGFVLTLIVMVLIIGSVSALYVTGRHYASAYTFINSAFTVELGMNLETISQRFSEAERQTILANDLSSNDLYARRIAEYQLARMNLLLSIPEPNQEQQQQFQTAIVNGVDAGRLATQQDATDPENWAALGRIYSILVGANIEQSYEFAKEALETARNLDPKNPLRYLELARLEAQSGNIEPAKQYAQQSVTLKPNYVDALFLLSQIAIAEGDVTTAIISTQAIINLDPKNSARRYQLGVLYASQQNIAESIISFEKAIEIDPNFANARYFLALAYSESGRPEDARVQLEKVLELNPDNQDVAGLISQLNENGSILPGVVVGESDVQPVVEQNEVSQNFDDVTTTSVPDTNLISPVNVGPESDTQTGLEVEGIGDGEIQNSEE